MTSSFTWYASHQSSGASSGSTYAAISLVTQQRRSSKQPSHHAVGKSSRVYLKSLTSCLLTIRHRHQASTSSFRPHVTSVPGLMKEEQEQFDRLYAIYRLNIKVSSCHPLWLVVTGDSFTFIIVHIFYVHLPRFNHQESPVLARL